MMMREKGYTLAELTVVTAVAAMMIASALVAFSTILGQSRLNGTVRQIVSDIRDARAQATMSGWQYMVVTFGDGAGADANRYRVLGRQTTTVDWPLDDVDPFTGDSSSAGPWVVLDSDISLEPNNEMVDSRCALTINARGAASTTNDCFNPLVVRNADRSSAVRVTAVGGVRTE